MPQTQRHTIYSHDPFTFLAPQRIKWFPVYSNGQLLYPQGRAALMVNMADVQILLQKWLVCLLGRPAAAERPAFGSRRLPGNSQMLEHGIGLSPPTLGALGSKEVLRASSTSIMCWSISGAIGPPLSSPPGSSVSQGCSVSPTRERRQSTVLGGGSHNLSKGC